MMNCEEFRNLIHDLAHEEASADPAVISALNHAESCRECDALLREAEQLTASLRSLALEHNSGAAPPRVETALLAAFRQSHGSGLYLQPGITKMSGLYLKPAANNGPAPRIRRLGGWLAVSAVGLAAAALLAVFLTGYRTGTSPESPRTPEAAPRETNRPSPRATWADYTVEGETEEQAAAAYIPLAADFDPSWLEGGAIVRVVLSRPALESLGVPVNAGRNGEMVADMVVSNDGTPEAIRVVDWQAANIQ